MNAESKWYPPRGEWLAMFASYLLIVGAIPAMIVARAMGYVG